MKALYEGQSPPSASDVIEGRLIEMPCGHLNSGTTW